MEGERRGESREPGVNDMFSGSLGRARKGNHTLLGHLPGVKTGTRSAGAPRLAPRQILGDARPG